MSRNFDLQPPQPGGHRFARPRTPLHRRPGFYIPAIFILSFGLSFGAMWWLSPTTNTLTGQRERKGSQAVRAVQNLFNPNKSLKSSFMGREQFSVLLIGLDYVPLSKKDPNPPRRADSVLLANIGVETKQARILSIPRDGWVEQLRLNRDGELELKHDKLGHSFSYGMQENQTAPLDSGLNRTKETVQGLFGQSIDFYIVIQFEGFVKLIDALGGLEVDVPKRMKYTDRAGNLYIDLQPGLQHLNGEQAVGYARFRHDKWGDIGRMERQQQVIKLVVEKLKQPEMLPRMPELAKLAMESVRTNLSIDQLYALAQHAKEFESSGIQTQTLMSYYNREPGHRIHLPGEYGGVAAQYIDPADIAKSMSWWSDLNPPPPPVVENPCGVTNPCADAGEGHSETVSNESGG